VGFALIDLDGFKPINDQFGHAAGDRVLVEIAQRLSSAANNSELVARLGGDEFGAVTWLGCNEVSLGRLVRNIQTAFKQPYVISGSNCYLSASVGTATYPADGETLKILLERADSRMYGLKRATKSRHEKWTA
jgi:diguanylate cyclase (GGDEF)-like protein